MRANRASYVIPGTKYLRHNRAAVVLFFFIGTSSRVQTHTLSTYYYSHYCTTVCMILVRCICMTGIIPMIRVIACNLQPSATAAAAVDESDTSKIPFSVGANVGFFV